MKTIVSTGKQNLGFGGRVFTRREVGPSCRAPTAFTGVPMQRNLAVCREAAFAVTMGQADVRDQILSRRPYHDAITPALYWHIVEFPTKAAAEAESQKHRFAAVTQIHRRIWLYVLGDKTEAVEGGVRRAAGPVGARIVAEVFLGLLQGDKGSYLSQDPEWQPFLPTVDASKTGDDFRMIDLLRYAEVA